MNNKWNRNSWFLLLSAASAIACADVNTTGNPSDQLMEQEGLVAASQIFSGTVVDATGKAVSGARVTINGITRLTSRTGRYAVSIAESRSGYHLDVRRDGYAPVTEFHLAGALNLLHVLVSGFTQVIDPTTANTVVDPDSGISVRVPPGSLRSNAGAPVGQVRFSIIAHSSQDMPGDFTAVNAKREIVAMISVGAATFQAVDSSNNTLGLIPGAALEVELPVPAAAGKKMPECTLTGQCRTAMWRFDPASALWIEQPSSDPRFAAGGTRFVLRAPSKQSELIDPADGIGTWNADVEMVNPACTIIEFTSVPLECYNPFATPIDPGIAVTFLQTTGTLTKSKTANVANTAPFLALYNLAPFTDVNLKFEFPAGAPAGCSNNLWIGSTPTAAPGFPLYYPPTGGETQLDTGDPIGYAGPPHNSSGLPLTLADIAIGDFPCKSYVQVTTAL
jgi:hypothetical protein